MMTTFWLWIGGAHRRAGAQRAVRRGALSRGQAKDGPWRALESEKNGRQTPGSTKPLPSQNPEFQAVCGFPSNDLTGSIPQVPGSSPCRGTSTRAGCRHAGRQLWPLEIRLAKIIEDQQRAEEERASRDVLRSVQGALKEALLALPAEEYDWFDLHRGEGKRRPRTAAQSEPGEASQAEDQAMVIGAADNQAASEGQRQFFEFAGPLFSVMISPTSSGGDSSCQGLPGYTFHKAAGELWRSRFDAERDLVVINNGHRDFVYAARGKMLKLRYICRLFAKELVLKNFIGIPPDQLLERLLELTLYTEENLR